MDAKNLGIMANLALQYPTVPSGKLIELILRFADKYDKEFEQFVIEESGLYE